MSDNKTLQTESTSNFFVIIADRDGVRKFVSKAFPRLFPYTTKINKVQRFYSRESALNFIERFNSTGRYIIENPEVREVQRTFKLI